MELKPTEWKPDPRVQALCIWARENEPLLTYRSDKEVEKIVRAARTEKAGVLAAIAIPFVVVTVYVTWRITAELFGSSDNLWQSVAVSVVAGAAVASIARFIGDRIMHREIARLARGTYGLLSHE